VSNARSRLAAYGRTPKALLRDPNIRPIAKTVFAIVDEVAGHEDITIARLAEWLGVNEKTARRALHEIRDAGWVEVIEVVEGQRGQRPSEYIANSYPFQTDDQAGRSSGVPILSSGREETGTPPSQKVPSTATRPDSGVTSTGPGVPESGSPEGSQEVGVPSSLRDDETLTTSRTTSSDGFREFWTAFPDGGYKYRREECRKIWLSLPLEDRHAAYRMLMLYKTSVLWVEEQRIPTPYQWLTNETWLSDPPRQVPPPIKFHTLEDIRLPD
jgi:HTH domain